MSINTEMFQKIYDQITQHPKTHKQSMWEDNLPGCGTTRCVAGWAIALHHGLSLDDSAFSVSGVLDMGRYINDDEYLSGIAVKGAEILGLTDEQAYNLFYGLSDKRAVEECLRYATKGDEADV